MEKEYGSGPAYAILGATGGIGAALLGAILLAAIWLSTMFLQVPQHGRLAAGFDAEAHRFLVLSNWIRTIAWTARGALALWMTAKAMA